MTQDDATLRAIDYTKAQIDRLPLDGAGRRKFPPALKTHIVKAWRQSDLKQGDFAELIGVPQSALSRWVAGIGLSPLHNARVKEKRKEDKVTRVIEITERMTNLKAELASLEGELRELIA